MTMRCPACGRTLDYVYEIGNARYSCRVDEAEDTWDWEYDDHEFDHYECPYCGYEADSLDEFIVDEDEEDWDDEDESPSRPSEEERKANVMKLKKFIPRL